MLEYKADILQYFSDRILKDYVYLGLNSRMIQFSD